MTPERTEASHLCTMPELTSTPYKITFLTGAAIVIANMVGTGVFTSLGFQVMGIQSGFALLMLWLVGGLIALCGAVSYGELAAAMPRSGGEYHYLSQIYHPALGFLSGWVSATVGFAAPTALAALALGEYAQSVWPGLQPQWLSVAVVLVLTLVHGSSTRVGSRLQVIITALKVVVLVVFIGAGMVVGEGQPLSFRARCRRLAGPAQPGLCREPRVCQLRLLRLERRRVRHRRNRKPPAQPLAHSAGRHRHGAPIICRAELRVPALHLHCRAEGPGGSRLRGGHLAFRPARRPRSWAASLPALLVSTISSMIFAGPRIVQTMGEDIPALRFLAPKSRAGIPVRALLLQTGITLAFILKPSFQGVLVYAGFVLNLFTFLTVLGLFVLRIRQPELPRPYRAWGYPITPLLFPRPQRLDPGFHSARQAHRVPLRPCHTGRRRPGLLPHHAP